MPASGDDLGFETPLLATPRNECSRISLHITRSVNSLQVNMKQLNFVVTGAKFSKSFSSNVGGIVVNNVVFRMSISRSVPQIFANEV